MRGAHLFLAISEYRLGRFDAAAEAARKETAAPPQSGLYEALGSAYWRTGKYPEAQEAYEQAVKIDPDDVIAAYKLGCLRIDRGDAAGGKPLLERVQVADPSLAMTSYYLGRAETQLGNNAAAVEDFKRTIRENLDDDTTKQAYFQLSRVYRRTHDMAASEQAQAEYRRLDQASKEVLQEKLRQRHLRADRDTSIPAPTQETAPTEP
jgi:tetratricopeptide (TPR) repeat protein